MVWVGSGKKAILSRCLLISGLSVYLLLAVDGLPADIVDLPDQKGRIRLQDIAQEDVYKRQI